MKTLQPLLTPATRAAVALAVVAIVSTAWVEAGRSSHQAVQLASDALTRTYVTLPTVEIVARREGATPAMTAQAGKRRTPST